jgi:L-cysteine/cystine lyase
MTVNPSSPSLELYRQQFPALANKSYFNYGGQGPLPRVALAAIQDAYAYIQADGPFSEKVNNWVMAEEKLIEEAIAAELNIPAATLTLTENVTVGCNIPLWGTMWQPGDHLLVSDCEHQGIIATIQELQRRFEIEVSVCPLMGTLNEGNPVEVVKQHLRSRTKMVVLSHLFWNTGQVLPLKEIVAACREAHTEKPIRILIDAAQSVGMLPLDLTDLEIDFYAFTGHKWWCGPEGVGGLYVRPAAIDGSDGGEPLHPTLIGWRGITIDSINQPTGWQSGATRYEVATSARPLYAGLRAAIALHQQWGSAEVRYRRILDLSEYLWEKLRQIPGINCLSHSAPQSGLVSFQLANSHHLQLVRWLENRGFYLRILLDPNCVRACVHYFTLESEIDELAANIAIFNREKG